MKQMFLVVLALFGPAAIAGLLVTEVRGRAEIQGKGVVTTLTEIAEGDRVTVTPGAHVVTVDLGSGREFVLKGDGYYTVAVGGPTAADGKFVKTVPLPAKNLPHFQGVRIAANSVAQASMVMRGMHDANVPLLVSPAGTAAISKTPVFRWHAVDAASGYRLVVTTLDGSVIWDITTRLTEMTLPVGRDLVPGESYRWRVEALGDGGPLSDASARFSVAQADAMARLDQLKPRSNAPFGRRVLYALALREAGAVAQAKEEWRALSREQPDDEVIRELAERH